jgi:hypothetical protein
MEGDADQMHLALCRLRNELAVHVRAESSRVSAMRDVSCRVVLSGQRRLIELIDDLFSVADDGATGCACVRRSVELTQMLIRQARLERAMGSPTPT